MIEISCSCLCEAEEEMMIRVLCCPCPLVPPVLPVLPVSLPALIDIPADLTLVFPFPVSQPVPRKYNNNN